MQEKFVLEEFYLRAVGGSFPRQDVIADPKDEQAFISWRGKSMRKGPAATGRRPLDMHRVQGTVRCEMMSEWQARLHVVWWVMARSFVFSVEAIRSPGSAVSRGEAGSELHCGFYGK